jgi:excinuclease ABC subunit C
MIPQGQYQIIILGDVESTFKTELVEINGIGNSTAQILLKEFKSVKKIKTLSLEELQNVIGKAKGKVVFDYFNSITQ